MLIKLRKAACLLAVACWRGHWLLRVCLATSMTPALAQVEMPINGMPLHGVQQVDLNLVALAGLAVPHRLQVVDANQQVMPMRLAYPQGEPERTQVNLSVYRWPASSVFAQDTRLRQLQLQLTHGEQQATVVFPNQPPLNLQQQGSDHTWLLAGPDSLAAMPVDYLQLEWRAGDFSSQVEVQGSYNLVDWHLAGVGQLLQTRNPAGQALLQQHIAVNSAYPYWRLQFDQPLSLQQARLFSTATRRPQWQQQPLQFKKIAGSPDQWLLQLPYAVAIQALQFDIAANQLWSVALHAKQYQHGRNGWQAVAQGEIFYGQNQRDNAHHGIARASNQLAWEAPVRSKQWRLTLQAPSIAKTDKLIVQAYAPKASLYFLAQGRAPYRLVIHDRPLSPAPALPAQLPVMQILQLGPPTVQATATSRAHYGLWGGLIVLVGILALAAWRLFCHMQHESGS